MFINYDSGVFISLKHVYENNICILTGKTKQDIMAIKYSKADYKTLLMTIFRRRISNE